jgi:hypothetical protein
MEEIHANLTKEQEEGRHQIEHDMIEVFNSTPNYTDKATIKIWNKVGPFPLVQLIKFDKVVIDFRHKYIWEKNSIKQYQGQHNNFHEKNHHGLARVEYEGGDMYEGQYVNGLKTGYGRYLWNNGDYYLGQFKNGALDGRGLYHFSTGKEQDGRFKNNVFVGKK